MISISREEISNKVKDVLVEALAVDEEEITEEATLMGDLGAESIDFLDIVFQLEKAFNIKIPREELFPGENMFNDKEFVQNGKLTAAGLQKLREQMPHVDFEDFAKDPDLNKMGDLFKVKTVCEYIAGKLEAA